MSDVLAKPFDPDVSRWDAWRPETVVRLLESVEAAKHADRERDQADFADVLPLLEPERRRWLAAALDVVHPGHAWLAELN